MESHGLARTLVTPFAGLPWRESGVPRQLAIVVAVSSALFATTARIVYRHLADEEADGHVVNVAGRQRMLSQRMARQALAFATGDESAAASLTEAAEEFRQALTDLLDGRPDRGLPYPSPHARTQLREVERVWRSMPRHVAELIDGPTDLAGRRERAVAVTSSADLLARTSEAAVAAFDEAFGQRVRRLRGRMTVIGVGGAAVLATTYLALLADATRRTARAEAAVARKEADLRELAEERRELVRRLLRASEDERRQVAGDIHDGPTQQLMAAAMLLEAAIADDCDAHGPQLRTARAYLDAAVEETRRIIADLRPPLLDDLGVAEALVRSLNPITRDFGVELRMEAGAMPQTLAPRTKETLFRVAHEAAMNAIRHSGASAVTLRLQDAPSTGMICLEVIDQGRGFDPGQVLAASGRRPLGLLGMRERIHLAGGRFDVDSQPGRGTRVTASVPAERLHAGD